MPEPTTKRGKSAPRMAPEQRRQQVLDSALSVVVRGGYQAATMQAIAREAGVTRPVVYEFYADRDELLTDLFGREAEKALSVSVGLVPAVLSGTDLESLVERSLTEFLQLVTDAPDTWRLMLMSATGAPESLRYIVQSGRAAILAQIRHNISLLPKPFGAADFDDELLATVAMSGSEAAARMVLDHPAEFPAARLSDVVAWLMGQITIAWST
ncbi:transcriptional regulator, TetR family [Nocardia nova SH22a]|uniref:Transcriptional regulator, TetR family n=1 Tax=Nocardia nova SH22a TaxID=1415166 RepID=W5TKV5_9NOCA|nr:TetR/AcrR family transcriptional regulator [Nocardia nova]AHH19985.1 transcriptional regulator, TetR family [Nocardia nova SH22a]